MKKIFTITIFTLSIIAFANKPNCSDVGIAARDKAFETGDFTWAEAELIGEAAEDMCNELKNKDTSLE